MKKNLILIVLIALATLTSITTKAQKNEINVSYGVVSANAFSEFYAESILNGITLGSHDFKNFKSTGSLGIDYYRSVSDHIKLGAALIYEQISRDYYFEKKFRGKIEANYITIMPQVKFLYITKPAFELYSSLAAGASLRYEEFQPSKSGVKKDDASDIFFAFQANLLGIRVGKKLGGFVELGLGNKGIINGGISYRF